MLHLTQAESIQIYRSLHSHLLAQSIGIFNLFTDMHDILEGCAKKEIALFLKYCITSAFISQDELNGIIKSYNYKYVNFLRTPSLSYIPMSHQGCP